MKSSAITVTAEIDAETAQIVEGGLDRFNETHNGPDPTAPLWVVCRDDDGTVLGGLQGRKQWDWFTIALLWVRDDHRGRGIGSALLTRAEQAARRRGCTRFWLATMTFQAPGFYAKHGYCEICRVPDFPPGHDYVWMTKTVPGPDREGEAQRR